MVKGFGWDRPATRAHIEYLATEAMVDWTGSGRCRHGNPMTDRERATLRKALRREKWGTFVADTLTLGLTYREATPFTRSAVEREALAQLEGETSPCRCCLIATRASAAEHKAEFDREFGRRALRWAVGQRVAVVAGQECDDYYEALEGIGVVVSEDKKRVYVRGVEWLRFARRTDRRTAAPDIAFDLRGIACDANGRTWRIWPATPLHEEEAWRATLVRKIERALADPQYWRTAILDQMSELLDTDPQRDVSNGDPTEPSPEWAAIAQRNRERDDEHDAFAKGYAAERVSQG